jgi:putative membrane protein
MWHWGYESWWMGVLMLLILASIVAVVVWVLRAPGRPGPGAPSEPHRTALDILEERYARGEIDDEEFRRRRQALRESGR